MTKELVVKNDNVDKKSIQKSKKGNSTKSTDTYYIQTGSFSKEPSSTYLAKIKNLGLSYNTEFKDNYKVFVGPYKLEAEARISLEKVRRHISKGAFLVHNRTLNKNESRETLY